MINLQSNQTVVELVQAILAVTGGHWIDQSAPDAPHEASKLNLAVDRAFHVLGWKPVWSFEQTVHETASFYQRAGQGESVANLCGYRLILSRRPRPRVSTPTRRPTFLTDQKGRLAKQPGGNRVAGCCLTRQLCLSTYLSQHHVVKHGLRMWFTQPDNDCVGACS